MTTSGIGPQLPPCSRRGSLVHHCLQEARWALSSQEFSCLCLPSNLGSTEIAGVYHSVCPSVNSGNLSSRPHTHTVRALSLSLHSPSFLGMLS